MTTPKTRHSIRCDRDSREMAVVIDGHLILRETHDGEIHMQVVSLKELVDLPQTVGEVKG